MTLIQFANAFAIAITFARWRRRSEATAVPDGTNFFISSLTPSHHVFTGMLNSIQSLFAIHYCTTFNPISSNSCSNHLNLPFLIIKLTGSKPSSSLSSTLFFLSFIVNPHLHLIMLISVLSNFFSCCTFISRV